MSAKGRSLGKGPGVMGSKRGPLGGVASLLAAVLGVSAAPAMAADPLGPTPVPCNGLSIPLCFNAAVSGTDTFNIGSHIVHVGQVVSGVYRWEIGGQGGGEFPSIGAVFVLRFGPGLKLLHCHGPLRANNSAAKWRTDKAFQITKGSTTCTWKANAPTNGWVNGPALSVYASGGTYPAGDFYAVLGKGSVIEGNVREENVRKAVEDLTGIPGAKVRITGPRGYVHTVTTSATGYYHDEVPRPGTYTVTPTAPKSYFKGLRSTMPKPAFRKVSVGPDDTKQADFTFKSTLKLELKLSAPSVPADGLSSVDVTVTATDKGAPDPGLVFSLRPYGGGSVLQSAWRMSVPATICSLTGTAVGGRVWPAPYVANPNTEAVDVTTNSAGEATFRVYTGTVPGKFPISVWARDNAGKLITQDVSDASADADVMINALPSGGDPTAALHDWLNEPQNAGLAGSLPTYFGSIVTALADAIHSGNLKHAFVLTPVTTTGGYTAVLLSPEGTRAVFDPATGQIALATQGALVAPNNKTGVSASSYWTALQNQASPPAFPTLAQMANNSAAGYSFPNPAGTISTGQAVAYLQYLGFGYGPNCIYTTDRRRCA